MSISDDTVLAPPSATDTLPAKSAPPHRGERDDESALQRGVSIGRYVVLGPVGAGGMGVVHAAYDPELDRKVAIKLLRADSLGSNGAARMLREAQAMARLAHPGVVTVHDVGTHRGQVWIAMEFVEGQTLRVWLDQRKHDWRDVLDVLLQAGAGLAAAHAAGLVHRDFKPENVMIGSDGRVRVMDFGLARAAEGGRTSAPEDNESSHGSALSMQLTQDGALLGTPAYMAPEQFGGAEVGEATDQFSFCVTLYEALNGERPFVGDSLFELVSAVSSGVVRPPPAKTNAPALLRAVLVRGLAVDPAQRHASMTALLSALDRARRDIRARRIVAASVAAVALALAGIGASKVHEHVRLQACQNDAQTIALVWPGERDSVRTRLHEAFGLIRRSWSDDTFARTETRLNSFTNEWSRVDAETCASVVERQLAPAAEQRRRTCLDQAHSELGALLDVLVEGDSQALLRAANAAASLSQPSRCVLDEELARRVMLPSSDEVSAVRAALYRVRAMNAAGRYQEGLRLAEQTLVTAEALDIRSLVAEAKLRVGAVADNAGDYARAREVLEEAFLLATADGDDETAARAAGELGYTLAQRLAMRDEALLWAKLGQAAVQRAGLDEHPVAATVFNATGVIHDIRGEYVEAEAAHRKAVRIWQQTVGHEHPDTATVLDNIGVVKIELEALDEAEQAFRQALEIRERTIGPDHPELATSLNNLGVVYVRKGQYRDARRIFERLSILQEDMLGPDHPELASTIGNLGAVLQHEGDWMGATQHYRRSLEILERKLGPNHPDVAVTLANLGSAEGELGHHERALELLQRALTIRERVHGSDDPTVADALERMAEIERLLGRHEPALEHFLGAIGIYERAKQNTDLATTLLELGALQSELERHAQASATLERALAHSEELDAADQASIRFHLAKAIWALGKDRARAVVLIGEAAEGLRDSGPDYADALAQAETLARRWR